MGFRSISSGSSEAKLVRHASLGDPRAAEAWGTPSDMLEHSHLDGRALEWGQDQFKPCWGHRQSPARADPCPGL